MSEEPSAAMHREEWPRAPSMTKSFRTLDDVDVKAKRVLLRVDLNVPMEHGRVTDATRLERIAPTITEISDKGGKVILLAHFGRPKGRDAKELLKPVAAALAEVIKKPVAFADDCVGDVAAKAVAAMKDGDILCLENTRFHTEKRRTIRPSSPNWQNSATSGSTTPSPPRTARTPPPKASATNSPPMPAAPCRPNSTRWARRWKRRRSR